MTFYERYEKICVEKEIEPCAQKTAELFGVTRSNISAWKRNSSTPSGNTVAAIANTLHVSTDYLLGRTEDSTDYTITPRKPLTVSRPNTVSFGSSTPKTDLPLQTQKLITDIKKLDDADTAKAIGFISGLLANDKYGV